MDDYKKKYEDAMARLELVTSTGFKLDPTYIFPELAESEDEKIRQDLIRFVKGYIRDETSEQRIAYLAWLEKQGEKKSQRMISAEAKEALYDKPNWSEEDDEHQRDAIYDAEKIYSAKCGREELVNWLKSLKERLGGE